MIRLLMAVCTICLLAWGNASAVELPFLDNFDDGDLDGWVTFVTGGPGGTVWPQDSQMWARASTGSDCWHCPECHAFAVIDDLIASDFVIDVKMTNDNNCGMLQLYLRTAEPTWSSMAELSMMDHWLVCFDPGLECWQLGARVGGVYQSPGMAQGWGFPFGMDVTHYIRIVMFGQSMELWHRLEGEPDYQHVHTLSTSGGSTDGHVVLAVAQSGKIGSFDDVAVYSGASPVELSNWGQIKALYR